MNIVQFPGLWGIEFEIRRWAFEVFGIQIFWYGIIIALGFFLAVMLAIRDSRKFGLIPDNILDLVLYAAPVAIVTARIFYVVFSWDQFKDNPIDIINTRQGGLAIYGAVIGAVAVACIFAEIKKIGSFKLLDFGVPFLVLAQGIGRWGNFVNQEAFGTPTTLPWRMNGNIPNEYLNSLQQNLNLNQWGVHPTFLYESLFDFAIFFFLLWYRKRKKLDGDVFCMYMILYGIGRGFIEGLRTDSLYLGTIRVSQMLAFVFAVVFLLILVIRRTNILSKIIIPQIKTHKKEPKAEAVEVHESKYSSVLMKLRESEENEDAPDKGVPGEVVPDEEVTDKKDP